MRTHDSVSVLIFHTIRQSFILVKQFRPAIYAYELEKYYPQVLQNNDQDCSIPPENLLPAKIGISYELCSGIVDKPGLTLEDVARQEVLEECGYDVPLSNIRKITSYRSGVGVTGSLHTAFYAEVTDNMKVTAGGGQPEEGELIELVEIPLMNAMAFAYNESIPKPAGVLFGLMWFQTNIAPSLQMK
ncbi:uridine diphosphate glucose pyrophosphatase NUDT14 [Protopterus annectens]|uniref:uridine diphosphate glucose pyrophosphatase NUDT14 n=1 Tax=Protopterus annectens TaxID=7888 RepID=UPI001CFBFB0A|nr:uridine diphosphate glucose pyrophosphatase NUDT14 [Protopterus annectens]